MPRSLKIILIVIAVIFGLLLSSMLIVPWQIKKQGSRWIAENTNRTLTIKEASFNPFTLTLELNGATLTEQNSNKPFVSFNRLTLSGSIESLIKQAVILDRLELDQPYLNIEFLGNQTFNFSDFTQLGGQTETTDEKSGDPVHFSLNNIVISGGKVNFTDQTLQNKPQHKIQELSLTIPVLGNIPSLVDHYVKPALSMRLNDAAVHVDGNTKPFHDSLETILSLSLDDVDLAYYAARSPIPLPVQIQQGLLNCEINLSYKVSSKQKPILLIGGEFSLSDLELRELDGRVILQLPSLILDLDSGNPFTKEFNLTSLDINDPQFYVNRDKSGQWMYQRVLSAQKIEDVKEKRAAEGPLLLLSIKEMALHDGKIHFQDDYVPDQFNEEISGINLKLDNVSTHLDQKTDLSLALQTDRNVTVAVNGTLGIYPLTAELEMETGNISLKPYYTYLEPFLTKPLEGTLNLLAKIHYGEDGNLLVQQSQLELKDLVVPFDDKDHFTLSDLNMTGSSFNLQQQEIDLGTIKLNGGDLKVTKLADGSFSPLQLVRQQPPAEQKEKEAEEQTSQPWNILAENVDLQKFKLLLTDDSLPKKPQIDISDLSFHAENLSYPDSQKSPFSVAFKMGRKGLVKVRGTAAHTPLQIQAQTDIRALRLDLFNNFVPENMNISLKDGQLFSSLGVNLKQLPDKFVGDFSGKLHVNNFDLRDPIGDGELLTWETLNIDGIKGKISPFAVNIDSVVLSNYLTNIQITKDGQVNLTSLTADEKSAAGENKESTSPQKDAAAEPPADISINTLTLQGGTVSFIDRHLTQTFSTTMYKLGGRVTGLASAEEMQADVDLRGQLENNSPMTINGKVNPLSKDLFADLTLSFKDIDLTPLTPYSGTYVGYAIDKGKLYLDLHYNIEHRKVNATNKVMIDQLTFGDSIESDKATSLPVTLAVALLQDNNNEIHLDIPVYGDFDDPDFSVGGVIFTVIKNLLVKAATSPFALIGSMLGGDEDFTEITFSKGLTTIDQEQLKKLGTLAEMLAKRPALTLEISGFVDRDNDPEAYRQEQLRQMLVNVKWRQLRDDGEAPATKNEIVISDEEYPEILWAVYKEAEFPRPRNFIGMLKKLPPEEQKKLLLSQIKVGEEELGELAKARARAVREALVTADETIKPRLFLKKTDIYQAPKKGSASRVEFNISSK